MFFFSLETLLLLIPLRQSLREWLWACTSYAVRKALFWNSASSRNHSQTGQPTSRHCYTSVSFKRTNWKTPQSDVSVLKDHSCRGFLNRRVTRSQCPQHFNPPEELASLHCQPPTTHQCWLNLSGDQIVGVSAMKCWVVHFNSCNSNSGAPPLPCRFVWVQHVGICLSLVKMHSSWWWLCWKRVSVAVNLLYHILLWCFFYFL